jgi:hypothetical protein
MTNLNKKNRGVIYFKGFGINFQHDQYEAEAYANPTFTNTNLKKLKQEINIYLRKKSS